MKKPVILLFLLSVMLTVEGCSPAPNDSSDSLIITKNGEKAIYEYLDTKTNDISRPDTGKMYSAFEILGTDTDRIYLLVLKEEVIRQDGNNVKKTNIVSLPVVLYIEVQAKSKVTGFLRTAAITAEF